MPDAYIVGIGMPRSGKHLSLSVKALTRLAVDHALRDAGIAQGAIQAAWFSNTRQGVLEGQHGIRGQCALRAMGFESIPIVNCDNACASSSTGVNQAYHAILAGACDIALVVGVEKMNFPDRRDLMFEAFWGGMDRELAHEHLQAQQALSADMELAPGVPIAGEGSVFMDSYAAMARHYMSLFGLTQDHLAKVAVKNHYNSQFNPLAHYQNPLSVEQILSDRLISWPLTRAMCAPMSDGAAALVLCSGKALSHFDRKRAVRILASQLASGVQRDPADFERHIGRIAADRAYEQAGIGPDDVDVAEVHDASSFAEIRHIENLRLSPIGDGVRMVETEATTLTGRIPVNTSGGLVSKGHPIAATGAIQLHELVMQLRGEAYGRQISRARIAAAENGGGFYAGEEAVAAVTLLEGSLL
ncbi:thiolase family protein [Bordetella trematum]|uniref:thiolase family protein n=1 Tax=Bordetella trematum TaxID=123899 RepID=UPI003AF361DB